LEQARRRREESERAHARELGRLARGLPCGQLGSAPWLVATRRDYAAGKLPPAAYEVGEGEEARLTPEEEARHHLFVIATGPSHPEQNHHAGLPLRAATPPSTKAAAVPQPPASEPLPAAGQPQQAQPPAAPAPQPHPQCFAAQMQARQQAENEALRQQRTGE